MSHTQDSLSESLSASAQSPNDIETVSSFDAFGLPESLVEGLTDMGITTPSPIQDQAIPPLLEGRDVLGIAQTGTGKTAAFGLPMLSLMEKKTRPQQAQGLVLAPTRELALQVSDALTAYAAKLPWLNVLPIYGGQSYGPQLSGLKRGVHIVVGTPGRVIDHIDRGSLDLSQLAFLALDEADEMLQMGFQEDVEHVLQASPDSCQIALFSATMPSAIRRIAKEHLTDPVEVSIKARQATTSSIKQRYVLVTAAQKVEALQRILETEDSDATIVFVRTKHATESLAQALVRKGIRASAINGDLAQAQRERVIEEIKAGKQDVLVATDVAARGLDVSRISHVVNYDIPHDTESYVHRIGRTGRAGRSGDAILFITPRERRLLRSIEKATGATVEQMALPSVQEVNAFRVRRLRSRVEQATKRHDFSDFLNAIDLFAEEGDVDFREFAAAALALAHGSEPLMARELHDPGKETVAGKTARKRSSNAAMVTYRAAVGRKEKVRPADLVGAIAREGGIQGAEIGRIDIRSHFSLIDLPKNLPYGVLRKLSSTRILGKALELELDQGGPGSGAKATGRKWQSSAVSPGDKGGKRKPRHGAKQPRRHDQRRFG